MKGSEKVRTFSELKKGWHFGHEGQPFLCETIFEAAKFAEAMERQGFSTDAFPGLNGEIRVTIYDPYYEFDFRQNGRHTFQGDQQTDPAFEHPTNPTP